MTSDNEILAKAVRAFVGEFTGYTPTLTVCEGIAALIIREAEIARRTLLLRRDQRGSHDKD